MYDLSGLTTYLLKCITKDQLSNLKMVYDEHLVIR